MQRLPSLIAAGLVLATVQTARVHAQPVTLADTWIEYDLEQAKTQSVNGLCILSDQSASGFTAYIYSNVLNSTTIEPYPSKSQYLPRVVQTFADQPITNIGSRVTVSFDLTINTPVPASANVGFRISMGDTNANNAVLMGYDFGTSAGGTVLMRYDATITQNTNYIDLDTGFYLNRQTTLDLAWGSFCDAGANFSASGLTTGTPNGTDLQCCPAAKHSFKFSLERTPVGLMVGSVWGSDAGPGLITTAGNPIVGGNGDDHNGLTDVRPWRGVNCFGICLFGTGSNPVSWDENGGSYTVSNLKIYSGILITQIERDATSGDVALTWESNPLDSPNGALYDVQYKTDLSSPTWTSLANTNISPAATFPEGFLTSYTNSATADTARYYRVQKVYP